MNKKLQKQIKAYAGFAGVLLAAYKANGQVIYVDINPDTLISSLPVNSGTHHFLIDINADAADDFDFFNIYNSSNPNGVYGIWVSPQDSNEIGNKSYNGSFGLTHWPAKLNYGDTISANGDWKNVAFQTIYVAVWGSSTGPNHGGAWSPGTDQYLAFRLVQNSNYYYGWIRIKILSHGDFLVKEYAYNTIPNVQLRAGHTTIPTGISEPDPQFNFSLQNNSIHISTFQKLNHANICVYDLLGKEILQQPFKGKETTIKIDKKGIYFVEVKPVPNSSGSEKGVFRKKVFIY